MCWVIIFTICYFDLYLLILLPILKLIVLDDFLWNQLLLVIAFIAIGAHHPICVFSRLIFVTLLSHVIMLVEVLVSRHVHAHPSVVLVAASYGHRLCHQVCLVTR